ncbi:MAG: hypothetical protein R2790_01550 [Flavobacterium haoranii]
MQKKDILIGLLFGLLLGFAGFLIVVMLLSNGSTTIMENYSYLKNNGSIGKVITLGAVPNLLLFFFFLNKNKEMMARGVILSMLVLTIITLLL